MLRAALTAFPASGKTTLFQLMTSARDALPGRGDVDFLAHAATRASDLCAKQDGDIINFRHAT